MYFISRTSLKWTTLLLLTTLTNNSITLAQQSAAGQDTLIAVIGRDYVMMGADSSSSGSGGIALLSSTSSDIDKLAVVHDGLSCTSVREKDDAIDALGQQAILVGCAGDAADADRLIGMLRAHAQVREFEAGIGNDAMCIFDGRSHSSKSGAIIHGTLPTSGLDCDAIAHLTRGEIASRMRSRQPLQLCLLVGGMVRCNYQPEVEETMQIKQRSESFSERVQSQVITGSQSYSKQSNRDEAVQEQSTTPQSAQESRHYRSESKPHLVPKLFWLDQYGSLQNLRYGAHGFGSNFALSILDQRYQSDLSREEAIALIRECFQQLRQRYVINSPNKARIKCVDAFGIRVVE